MIKHIERALSYALQNTNRTVKNPLASVATNQQQVTEQIVVFLTFKRTGRLKASDLQCKPLLNSRNVPQTRSRSNYVRKFQI